MGVYFDNLSVLVVDGQHRMGEVTRDCLQALGFGEVVVCNGSDTAFETFCRDNHDIVITEWMLKPMSGLDLVSLIRRDFRSPNRLVPIFMLTGYSSLEHVKRATQAGVHDYIVKPFDVDNLAERLARVINNPSAFMESSEYTGPIRSDA